LFYSPIKPCTGKRLFFQPLRISHRICYTTLATLAKQERILIEELPDVKAVYLTPLHVAEVNVARRLRALIESPKQPLQIDVKKAIEWVQSTNHLELAETQKLALRKAISGKVLVLTEAQVQARQH
jgi:exodeoxyribonuclease V alpha subunit